MQPLVLIHFLKSIYIIDIPGQVIPNPGTLLEVTDTLVYLPLVLESQGHQLLIPF